MLSLSVIVTVVATVATSAVPVKAPVKFVDVRIPEDGLYVNPVSVSIPCVPVAPSTKVGYTVSSVELLALVVILVASVEVVAFPLNAPVNVVDVRTPVLGLYVNPVSV